jgi:hypothetical protein
VDESNDVFIHIGGSQRCISISVNQASQEAILLTLRFHESCETKQQLKRGTCTVHMLKSAVTFLYRLYPNLQHIQFADTSFITCFDGVKVDLPSYYMALKGMTWYEHTFGATPEANYKEMYIQCKKNYHEYLRTRPSYQSFMKGIDPNIVKTLKPLYKICDSLKTFIQAVNDEYDCYMFQDWLFRIMILHIPFIEKITWEIDITNLILPDITIQKHDTKPRTMFSGGGKIGDMLRFL